MSETFQAAVDLAGLRRVAVEASVENVERRATLVREAEILHRDKFSDREAVVYLGQPRVGAGVPDARLGIGALGGLPRIGDEAAVPGSILRFPAVAGAKLDRLHGDRVCDAEPARDIRRRDDRAGGAVGDAATVEQPQ